MEANLKEKRVSKTKILKKNLNSKIKAGNESSIHPLRITKEEISQKRKESEEDCSISGDKEEKLLKTLQQSFKRIPKFEENFQLQIKAQRKDKTSFSFSQIL